MSKLNVNDLMPDFPFATPYAQGLSLAAEAAKAPKTALMFLRYYGCTLCQYDIQQMVAHYDEITAGGGQLFVVLQSDPEKLHSKLGDPSPLPFSIICDPAQTLYQRFGIEAAEDLKAVITPKDMEKIQTARASGLSHGDYEGNEQQLPAAFVIGSDCRILYAHYAQTLTDIPDVQELAELLR